jgi:hypothetical protein
MQLAEETIEYYNEAEELLAESDIVEIDIRITGWSKKLRIRALTFGQMERINRMATVKQSDEREHKVAGELDNEEFVYWTIKEGVIRPRFTITQARKFIDNNGEFVRQLSDEIWNLGRISKRAWDAYIEEQKKLAAVNNSDNPNADEHDNETTDSDE